MALNKVIITGALGHIGSALIRMLAKTETQTEIVMIDSLATQRYCSLFQLPEHTKYSFLETDVRALSPDILQNAKVVIHLAAMTNAAGTLDKATELEENNLRATTHITDLCLAAHVPLIFPSSTSVYGSQEQRVDESCLDLIPQSPYAACKLKEEDYIRNQVEQGLEAVILRFGTIYGISPGMRFHTAVNKFCWDATISNQVQVWRTALHQKRPYLALQDCCRALCWIIQQQLYAGETYNVVTGNHTVADVLQVIQQVIPKVHVEMVDHQIMNQLSYEVDSDRFLATGFQYQGSLAVGIRTTLDLLTHKIVAA